MAACGGESSGAWAGSVTDSAGGTLVNNPPRGLWEEGEGWSFEEVYRAGGMDVEVEGQLGLVFGVDVDALGRVYVADQQAREIVVFDADGAPLRRMGGPGNGPGEFGMQLGGVFVDGDQVVVPDIMQARVSAFDTAGAFVRSYPLAMTDGIPILWDRDDAGRIAVQRRAFNMEGGTPEIGGSGDQIEVFSLAEGEGETEVLGVLSVGESFSIEGGTPRVVVMAPEPLWDLEGDGRLAQAMNNEFRVEIREGGDLARVITLPREPVEVTETEANRIRGAMREFMVQMGTPPEAVQPVLQGMEFHESYPLMAQLKLLDDGSLLVQRIVTAREAGEDSGWSIQDLGSDTWDVFDPEGRYMGPLQFPGGFVPVRAVDGILWGVQADELDVQSIVGLRIVR
jgi:hypothetical protein